MNRTFSLIFSLVIVAAASLHAAPTRDDSAAEKLGWQLAAKGYTFRAITLSEAIDISKTLGLKYFEVNPRQKWSKEKPENTDQNSSAELRAEMKKKFAAAGIEPVSYGVIGLGTDEAADRKIFEYTKEMGIQVIVSEPPPAAFDLLEKLTREYGIKIAIHNHPSPSPYWQPETVLKAVEGHNLIGSCSDVGHWTRSGLSAVDSLKKLEGHIFSLHLKDVDSQKEDVPFGTGNTGVKNVLTELRRQNFKGVLALEYESGSGQQLIDDLKKCIEFFDRTAVELAGEKK